MTDPPSTLPSHNANTGQATTEKSSVTGDLISAAKPAVSTEEPVEDFTLKCICGYVDAEQNTVYCENCDTWQHTECYYIDANGFIPTNAELEHLEHLCVDCSPRQLDAKGATERQRARLEEFELSEKKIRKTAAKSHKKKTKAAESNGILTNGWANGTNSDAFLDRTSRSPRDSLPTTKKPKTNHRTSNSTSVASASHPPPTNSHRRATSNVHSPSKFVTRPGLGGQERELFSPGFLHLYDNDPGDKPLDTNFFNDIHITSDLSLWSNDIEALRKATPKFSHPDIFQRLEQPISSMQMPELCVQEKVAESLTIDGRHPRWKYLTVNSWTPKGAAVGEIKGKIGHMTEYIKNTSNQWEYLRHPAPFVFFHPRLPIYIDTRTEGTTCRYLRRSCAPNLAMKTFLENGSEYHFCFVAQCDLDPGSELTVGWVPDENMRRFFDPNHNGVKQEIGADQEEYIADWASKVLPEFGGCACESTRCTWDRFVKRGHSSTKARGGHSKNHIHSSMNHNLTHSRDGSDQDERRSSSESKSASRDVTPTEHNSIEGALGPGLEISAREKRKIAALEKNFEQLGNDRNQPAPKKKKRNSGGSTINTPNVNASKQLGHSMTSVSQPNTPGLSGRPQYTDSGTSRRRSGSPLPKSSHPGDKPKSFSIHKIKQRSSLPNTPSVRSPTFRKNYVSTAVQTEPIDDDDWSRSPQTVALTKKPYTSLTKRLLLRSQRERQLLEQRRRVSQEGSPEHINNNTHATQAILTQADVEMKDVVTAAPVENERQPQEVHTDPEENKQLAPPLLMHPASIAGELPETNGLSPADLPGQPPPKPPEVNSGTSNDPPVPLSPSINSSTLPSSTTILAPPPSNHIQPSPVTKRISLSEWALRRKGSTSVHDKSSGGSPEMSHGIFKPLLSVNGDGKLGSGEDSAIVESPKREISDPIGTETTDAAPIEQG